MITKETVAHLANLSRIDFDEQALPNAVKVFCGTVYDILG